MGVTLLGKRKRLDTCGICGPHIGLCISYGTDSSPPGFARRNPLALVLPLLQHQVSFPSVCWHHRLPSYQPKSREPADEQFGKVRLQIIAPLSLASRCTGVTFCSVWPEMQAISTDHRAVTRGPKRIGAHFEGVNIRPVDTIWRLSNPG